jgi:cytoskeletal protein RodZ
MNKKIILVILIILGVVAVSGCISNEETSTADISNIDSINDTDFNDTNINNDSEDNSSTTESETVDQDSSSSSSYSTDSSSEAGEVLITRTGSKYHTYVHGNMKYYDYVSLAYAEKYYDPCSICC